MRKLISANCPFTVCWKCCLGGPDEANAFVSDHPQAQYPTETDHIVWKFESPRHRYCDMTTTGKVYMLDIMAVISKYS